MKSNEHFLSRYILIFYLSRNNFLIVWLTDRFSIKIIIIW